MEKKVYKEVISTRVEPELKQEIYEEAISDDRKPAHLFAKVEAVLAFPRSRLERLNHSRLNLRGLQSPLTV